MWGAEEKGGDPAQFAEIPYEDATFDEANGDAEIEDEHSRERSLSIGRRSCAAAVK